MSLFTQPVSGDHDSCSPTILGGNLVALYFQMVTDARGVPSSCFLAGPAFLSGLPQTEFVLLQILTLLLQELSASHLAALKTDGWKNTTRSFLKGWRPFQPQEGQRKGLLPGPNAHTLFPHLQTGCRGNRIRNVWSQGDQLQHFVYVLFLFSGCVFFVLGIFFFS